jgi:anti-sigma factor RsiW
MTACKALREDIDDAALGERISDELQVHLRDCTACTMDLERRRALAGRMDAAVHRFVREQPPAQLLSSTIASVRRAQPSRPWTRVWPPAAIATALVASIIGVTIGVHAIHPATTRGADAPTLATWHSPTAELLDERGSILEAPLRDRWFDPRPQNFHSQRKALGETHGA